MRRLVVTAISVGAIGMATTLMPAVQAAGGTTRTVSTTDPSGDVDSRLDIVFASFRDNSDGTATLTIRTAKSWGCRYLRDVVGDPEDTASANLFWDFDQGANGTFEIAGHFQCDENGLYFELLHSGYRERDKVFAASRPTARSARTTFPLSELRASHVSMRAMSRVTGVIGNNVFFDEEDLAPSLRAY